MTWQKILALAAWLLGAAACAPALAHDVPPSIVMLDIGRRAIAVELQLPLGELGAALSLPFAAAPGATFDREGPRLRRYVAERFQLRAADGRPFALDVRSLSLKTTQDERWSGNDWLVVRAVAQAPEGASTETFGLDDTLIVHRVVSHESMVYVRRDLRNGLLGEQPMLVGMAGFGNTHLQVDGSGGSWWQGVRHLFSLGLHHIAEGPDHLLFLLALLLPAPLLARGGRWQEARGLAASVRTIVGVVTGFTLGHSVSLALASAGWVAVPTRAVEVLVAASILVSCVHAWRPLFAGREIVIASTFGLVHGLAFAEVLAGLDFDGATLALSLLGFNLGIEAMQLVVIAAVLPTLLLLARSRFHPVVRLAGALFAGACALGWIVERAFGRPNPMQAVADWLAPPPPAFAAAVGLLALASLALLLKSRQPVVNADPATTAG